MDLSYHSTLSIYEELRKTNFELYKRDIVEILNQLHLVFYFENQPKKALMYIKKALKIQRSLKKNSPGDKLVLAKLLNNFSLFLDSENKLKSLKKVLGIYKELAKLNPVAYNHHVAKELNIIASSYKEIQDFENAEVNYIESLSIYKQLLEINEELFFDDYSLSLQGLATFYQKIKQYKKAEEVYLQALKIYKKLAINNPYAYSADVAHILSLLGGLYNEMDQPINAKKAYLESLSYYLDVNKYLNFRT
jgi:tetratricopeptide (TPR) repeat protein